MISTFWTVSNPVQVCMAPSADPADAPWAQLGRAAEQLRVDRSCASGEPSGPRSRCLDFWKCLSTAWARFGQSVQTQVDTIGHSAEIGMLFARLRFFRRPSGFPIRPSSCRVVALRSGRTRSDCRTLVLAGGFAESVFV